MPGKPSCRIKKDMTRIAVFLYFRIQTSGSPANVTTIRSQRKGSVIFSST